MASSFRRVETGHDKTGRAVIRSDGAVPHTVQTDTWTISEALWLDGVPGSVDDGRDRPGDDFPLEPPPGGASFRLLRMSRSKDNDGWIAVPGDDSARPGWHATDTLDVVCLIDGAIELELDDGGHLLQRGDVVIQRGTGHRWRVSGDQPCTYAVLMLRPDPRRPAVSIVPRAGDREGRLRRLVTGVRPDGLSAVDRFETPPVVLEPSGPDGVSLVDLWQTGGPVARADQGGDAHGWILDPIGNGVSCRSPRLPGGMVAGDTGWHATDTIDLNVVLSGRLRLNLPDGITTVLEPGDTVLQRGTNHQWEPVGTEPVEWFAVMFGIVR